MTLDETFNPRRNSLNAIRLLLASLVVVSHSWLLSGSGPQPELGGMNLGTWAVLGFFAISGFLITRSRLAAKSASSFYWNRALRILPGFLVCLAVVAFALAPLSVTLSESASYSLPSALGYVLSNLPLAPQFFAQKGIEGTLPGLPVTGLWNGPLWTLFWEGCCYVLVGVLVTLFGRRWMPLVSVSLFVISSALVVLVTSAVLQVGPTTEAIFPLFAAFFAGSIAYLFARRIDVSWPVMVACALATVAAVIVGYASAFAAVPMVLMLLRLASALPFQGVGSRYDISYGIYIYGWPLQQLLALIVFGSAMPVAWFIVLSLALAAPLAFASSVLVERPGLARKRVVGEVSPLPHRT